MKKLTLIAFLVAFAITTFNFAAMAQTATSQTTNPQATKGSTATTTSGKAADTSKDNSKPKPKRHRRPVVTNGSLATAAGTPVTKSTASIKKIGLETNRVVSEIGVEQKIALTMPEGKSAKDLYEVGELSGQTEVTSGKAGITINDKDISIAMVNPGKMSFQLRLKSDATVFANVFVKGKYPEKIEKFELGTDHLNLMAGSDTAEKVVMTATLDASTTISLHDVIISGNTKGLKFEVNPEKPMELNVTATKNAPIGTVAKVKLTPAHYTGLAQVLTINITDPKAVVAIISGSQSVDQFVIDGTKQLNEILAGTTIKYADDTTEDIISVVRASKVSGKGVKIYKLNHTYLVSAQETGKDAVVRVKTDKGTRFSFVFRAA